MRRLPLATCAATALFGWAAYLIVGMALGGPRPRVALALGLTSAAMVLAAVLRVRRRRRQREAVLVVDELALARARRVARAAMWNGPTERLPTWTQPSGAWLADAVSRAASDELRLQLLCDLETPTGELRRRLEEAA